MYDVEGKLFSGVKSMYVDRSACVKVKEGESEWYGIDSGVRPRCIMSPRLFNIYMNGVMKEVKMGMGESGRLSGVLYSDDLILCGVSEEDLRAILGQFAEVYKRKD